MSSNISYENNSLKRFEYKKNGSYKFWEIIKGSYNVLPILETRWGRIGNTPQKKIKEYKFSWERDDNYIALINSKLMKGYKEVEIKKNLAFIDKPILMIKKLTSSIPMETPVLGKKPRVGVSDPEEPKKKVTRADLLEID